MDQGSNRKNSALLKLWRRIPLPVRAIAMGLAVSTLGIAVWQVLAFTIPMPFSFSLMAFLLVVYLMFFSGKWGPPGTKGIRAEFFRSTNLTGKTWIIAICAALIIVFIEQAGLVVTFRILEFPSELFREEYNFLELMPEWAGWLVIIMISLVAGICEEVGFRGYMQYPLERRYGPFAAVTIVSVVFVLVHLHQAWSAPIIIHIFVISALFGVLAYRSSSLLPGIIGHVIMDIFNFSFWWSDLGNRFDKKPIASTGIDTHFLLWFLGLIISLIIFFILLRLLGNTEEYHHPPNE
jgi:hypothetical protein